MILDKYVGIIGFLILVILSSGCVSIGVDKLNMNDNPDNFTELNKTANGTYSVAGISFKCHDNWGVCTYNENEKIIIAACQINDSSSFQPQFEVDIIPNKDMSEQEATNQAKKEIYFGYKKVSSSVITIDGNKAYESIFAVNDPVLRIQSKVDIIYFIKNGKTYLITFSAIDKDFDKEKANFDMILNSFKVQ